MHGRTSRVYMGVTDDQHCWTCGRCACCRKNQAGANLKCDELHDELQQSESPLPIDMRHLPPKLLSPCLVNWALAPVMLFQANRASRVAPMYSYQLFLDCRSRRSGRAVLRL